MDGWGIKTKRREGAREGEEGEKERSDCEEAFSSVSSHLQVRRRGEWVSD